MSGGADEAFQKKEYDRIVESLPPLLEWEAAVGVGKKIPIGGLRKTPMEVKAYFKELEETLLFKKYEVKEFIAENDKVVVLGYYHAIVKQTEKPVQTPFVAVFTIKDEKLVKYRAVPGHGRTAGGVRGPDDGLDERGGGRRCAGRPRAERNWRVIAVERDQWQEPVPMSLKLLPAIGMNCQS